MAVQFWNLLTLVLPPNKPENYHQKAMQCNANIIEADINVPEIPKTNPDNKKSIPKPLRLQFLTSDRKDTRQ